MMVRAFCYSKPEEAMAFQVGDVTLFFNGEDLIAVNTPEELERLPFGNEVLLTPKLHEAIQRLCCSFGNSLVGGLYRHGRSPSLLYPIALEALGVVSADFPKQRTRSISLTEV